MSKAKYLNPNPRKQPKEISEILGKVIESAAVGVDVRQAEMIHRWSDVVPEDWAMGNPVGVREGVLLVEVPNGATASVLQYQIDPLLRVLGDEFGSDVVRSVRVRIKRS